MKPTKRLTLLRESFGDLTTDELRNLPAGNNALTPQCTTLQVECPSDPIMGCTVFHPTEQQTCIC